MADIRKLTETGDLKLTLVSQLAAQHQLQTAMVYDDSFDTLRIFFVAPDQITIVHHVDGDIAFLVLPESLEIVGLHIEDFLNSFVPQHDTVERIWKLSDTGIQLRDLGDVIVTANRMTKLIAFEIVKASEDALGEPGLELAAALA